MAGDPTGRMMYFFFGKFWSSSSLSYSHSIYLSLTLAVHFSSFACYCRLSMIVFVRTRLNACIEFARWPQENTQRIGHINDWRRQWWRKLCNFNKWKWMKCLATCRWCGENGWKRSKRFEVTLNGDTGPECDRGIPSRKTFSRSSVNRSTPLVIHQKRATFSKLKMCWVAR